MRRPSVAASHLNRAVRAGLQPLLEFLDLGAPMREAQAALSVAELQAFGVQRRALEDQVVREVVRLLGEHGVSPSPASLDEVRQTLTAALADPEAERAVRSGCLARSLSYAGFGAVDLDDALAAEPDEVAPARRDRSHLSVVPDPVEDEDAADDEAGAEDEARRQERARAERMLARLQRALDRAALEAEQADADRDEAERSRERAERRRAEAEEVRERAERAEQEARKALERASAELAAAGESLAEAETEAEEAERRLTRASSRAEQASSDLAEARSDLADQQQLLAAWPD